MPKEKKKSIDNEAPNDVTSFDDENRRSFLRRCAFMSAAGVVLFDGSAADAGILSDIKKLIKTDDPGPPSISPVSIRG